MAKIEQTFMTKQIKLHGEIRKVEVEDNSFTKDGKTIETKATLLTIDDDDEERVKLYDKQSDAIQTYQRGQVGTFTIRLDYKPTFGVLDGKLREMQTANYNSISCLCNCAVCGMAATFGRIRITLSETFSMKPNKNSPPPISGQGRNVSYDPGIPHNLPARLQWLPHPSGR